MAQFEVKFRAIDRILTRCQPMFMSFHFILTQPLHSWRMRSGLTVLISVLIWNLLYTPAQSQQNPPNSTPQTQTTQPDARTVLKLGSQGESVTELQAMLKLLGFYSSPVDGNYQQSTADAVSAFQRSAGLNPDGVVGGETWNRLLPPSPPVNTASTTATPVSTTVSAAPPSAPSTPTAPAPTASTPFPSPTIPTAPSPNPTATPAPSPAPTPAPNPTPSPVPSPTATPTPAPNPAPSSAPRQTPSPSNTSPSNNSAPPASTSEPNATAELPVLRVGMRGSAVEGLQERLKAIGFFSGAIDGVFGTETQAAVQAAQRNFGLEADGVVGPATWLALLR